MQTENKWLNEIDDVETDVEQIDEYIQVIGMAARAIGQMAVKGAQVAGKAAQAGAKVAGKAAKATAKGAARAGKAAAKGAKRVAKGAKKAYGKGKDIKKTVDNARSIKDKAKQLVNQNKDKMQQAKKSPMDRISKTLGKVGKMAGDAFKGVGDEPAKFGGAEYDDETTKEVLENFRFEVRKKLIRELMEAEPAGDDGDGKGGMNPEVAKEIMKNLEGKTVKSKSGKEIKVASALNPNYKKTDPRAHKKATDMFKKAAEDFYSKNSRKKQGGKVPKNPEDLKAKDSKNNKDTKEKSPNAPDQKPDVKKPAAKKTTPKDPKDMNQDELQGHFTKQSAALTKSQGLLDKAKELSKKNPDDPKTQKALQQAADENFAAEVGQSQAVMTMMDKYSSQADSIKNEHPNPLSKERRSKLKALREEKKREFDKTGMTTKQCIHMTAQKDIKDRWDNSIDPSGDGDMELTQVVDGKNVEVASTRINPETGNVDIVSYEVDEDGNKVTDEGGNYNEIVSSEEDMQSSTDAEAETEAREERKEYWKDFFKNQFDFSDKIDFASELELEFGSSGFVQG